MAARELRKEARAVAVEKLSARRAGALDGASLHLDLEMREDQVSELPGSYRSDGGKADGDIGHVDAREEASPDYAEEFDCADSGHDAVAQHVNAFMGAGADDNDAGSLGDEGQEMDGDQQLEHADNVRTQLFHLSSCIFLHPCVRAKTWHNHRNILFGHCMKCSLIGTTHSCKPRLARPLQFTAVRQVHKRLTRTRGCIRMRLQTLSSRVREFCRRTRRLWLEMVRATHQAGAVKAKALQMKLPVTALAAKSLWMTDFDASKIAQDMYEVNSHSQS
jgi:hypothetical protein